MIRALLLACCLPMTAAVAFHLPADCGQVVVGTAADWNASHAQLTLYEKRAGRWQAVGVSWPARLGRNGLAWGLGLHPNPAGAVLKREGDLRAPAGIFELGGAWGDAADVPRHPKLAYRKVTPRDLWVEDPGSPHYNRHLVLPREPASAWEKKQQMKQNDPAHALKLFIAHNAGTQVKPGGGSAIFFHIWREGGKRPSAGCTVMSAADLGNLVRRIDPTRRPLYVLLPQDEYKARKRAWKLP